MSRTLKVTFDSVTESVSRLGDAQTSIATILAKLESESNSLAGSWSGQAADAYADAKTRWAASLVELNGTLSDAIGALSTANERYRTADIANGNRWLI